MLNKIWLVVMVVVMGMLGGCAASPAKIMSGSIDQAHKLAKDGSGIVYGAWIDPDSFAVNGSGITVKSACDYIHNNDDRCNHQEDYVVGDVIPKIGGLDGAAQILAFIPKNIIAPLIKVSYDDYTYVKVQAKRGGIGEVLEVVSLAGDKKCYWSGLPLGGGVVCPAYNWDYRKDLRDYDTSLMVMSVSDK